MRRTFASILAAFLALAGTIFPAAAQDLKERKIGVVIPKPLNGQRPRRWSALVRPS
jgi:ABC-type sugar transport system substrate-binding protein